MDFCNIKNGKISASDNMRIQTLHELGLGYSRIASKFPDKQCNLQSAKNICRRVDQWVQPLSENLAVKDCAQQGWWTTSNKLLIWFAHKKMHQEPARAHAVLPSTWVSVRGEFSALQSSTCHSAFRHVPAQVIKAATRQKRWERCKWLLCRLSVTACKHVFHWWEGILPQPASK